MHAQISLVTKFQLKLTSLIFWIKFDQKVHCQSKTEGIKFHLKFQISVGIKFHLKLTTLKF